MIGQEGDQRPDERDRRLGLRGQHAGGGLWLRGEGGTIELLDSILELQTDHIRSFHNHGEGPKAPTY